jgi:Domain of unknown function (DUF4126)
LALPPEVLILVPLAVAAGVDLYLVLLVLGAAPTLGWWGDSLPGALGDLGSLGVLLMVGGFYLLEFAAERHAPTALVWNAFHAVIRPLAGALLALLLLDGLPLPVVVGGAVVAAVISSAAHAVRSGGAALRWLGSARAPNPLLVSLLEDALVLGIVALALDRPAVALAVASVVIAGGLIWGGSPIRAFAFTVRLATIRAFGSLTRGQWDDPEAFPGWISGALQEDVMSGGGGLRGSPVGAYLLPGAPRFVRGWVVVRGGPPVFMYRHRWAARRLDLGTLVTERVVERGFFRRVDLVVDPGQDGSLFFTLRGPSAESLRAEFSV